MDETCATKKFNLLDNTDILLYLHRNVDIKFSAQKAFLEYTDILLYLHRNVDIKFSAQKAFLE